MYRTVLFCSTLFVMSPMTFGSESLQSESEWVTDAEFELATIRRNLAWIGGHIDNISNSVDTFFAPEQNVSNNKSLVQVNLSHLSSEHLPSSNRGEVRLYVRLPKIEERWNLFVESAIAPDEQDTQGSAQSTASAEQETSLGLSTLYKISDTLGLQTRLGLTATEGQADPYLKLRLRYEKPINQAWFLSFEPEWFWLNVYGPGKQATLNLAYQHSKQHHFRARSNIFKYNEDLSWDVSQNFEWQHRIDDNNRINYQAGRLWQWRPADYFERQDTYAQISWRHQLYEGWIYLVTTPGVHAPIELNEKPNPFILLSLEFFSRPVPL